MSIPTEAVRVPFKRSYTIGVNSWGEIYTYDDDKVKTVEQNELDTLGNKVEDFVVRVQEIQDAVNDERCRAYGRMVAGRPHISLVTELVYFVDDKEAHDKIDKFNRQKLDVPGFGTRQVYVDEMYTEPHTDKYGIKLKNLHHYYNGGLAGRIIEKIESVHGELYLTTKGPDHDRMERQVEVYIDIVPLTKIDQIKAAKEALIELTESLWSNHGVCVL